MAVTASPERPTRRAWAEVYAPVCVAFLGAGAAVAFEPATRAWMDGGVAFAPGASSRVAWLAIGPVLTGALLSRGATMALGREPPSWREAGAWGACAALAGMLALADRLRLLEAQALLLGTITLVWWRSDRLERAAHLEGTAAGSGLGVLAVLSALALGAAFVALRSAPFAEIVVPIVLGAASLLLFACIPKGAAWGALLCLTLSLSVAGIGRVVASAVLSARAAESSGAGNWVFAVADSLAAPAYLSGLAVISPEAVACLVACVATLAVKGSPARRSVRLIGGFGLLCAGAGLVVRWALGGWWSG